MIIFRLIIDNLAMPLKKETINYFTTSELAYKKAEEIVFKNKGHDITTDPTGKLDSYSGISIESKAYHKSPAVYYKSYFGSSPCVVYVQKLKVHDK